MPTIPEAFLQILNDIIQLGTHPCACADRDGECFLCHGTREEPPLYEEPCSVCRGSGLCNACGGTKIFVPAIDSDYTLARVLGSTIVGLRVHRDAERFDEIDELLDVVNAWIWSMAQREFDNSSPEQIENALKAVQSVLEPQAPKPNVDQALTEQELRDLGLK